MRFPGSGGTLPETFDGSGQEIGMGTASTVLVGHWLDGMTGMGTENAYEGEHRTGDPTVEGHRKAKRHGEGKKDLTKTSGRWL